MLTNQFIRDQLAQITNAKRITIYVGMNEFHALVMNGLNQSMKFEGLHLSSSPALLFHVCTEQHALYWLLRYHA